MNDQLETYSVEFAYKNARVCISVSALNEESAVRLASEILRKDFGKRLGNDIASFVERVENA